MNVGLKFKSVVWRKATAFNIVFDFILLLHLRVPYLRQPFVRERLLPLGQQRERVQQVQLRRVLRLHQSAIWRREDTKGP